MARNKTAAAARRLPALVEHRMRDACKWRELRTASVNRSDWEDSMSFADHFHNALQTALPSTLRHNGNLPRLGLKDALQTSESNSLVDFVLLDQQQRWDAGQPVDVEAYVAQYPQLSSDLSLLLDIVYHEYLLCEAHGQCPDAAAYLDRFPQLAAELKKQIQFHEALERPAAGTSATPAPAAVDPYPSPADASNTVTAELLPRIGRYLLIAQLGKGGMGVVYRARDTELDRDVALKLPRSDNHLSPETNARFVREAKALAALRHPNICPIYDFGKHDEQYFLVMPLLEGTTLDHILKQNGKLAPPQAVQLATVLANALHVLHQHGIVHRDLKPSNIMLDADGDPVVLDFGLVFTHEQQDLRLTSSGMIAGTPAYMAPERWTGQRDSDSVAADVYGLGVILYELLTGRLPYCGSSAAELLSRALTEEAEPPSKIACDIPENVEQACLTALAKTPDKRFASMLEFAQALQGDKKLRKASYPPRMASRILLSSISAAIVLVSIAAMVLSGLTGRNHASLQVGEKLVGEFRFIPNGPVGDVEIFIREIHGSEVAGTYQTEGAQYVWEFQGKLSGDDFLLKLTEAITESAKAIDAARGASIHGSFSSQGFVGRYRDRDSEAVLKLYRE